MSMRKIEMDMESDTDNISVYFLVFIGFLLIFLLVSLYFAPPKNAFGFKCVEKETLNGKQKMCVKVNEVPHGKTGEDGTVYSNMVACRSSCNPISYLFSKGKCVVAFHPADGVNYFATENECIQRATQPRSEFTQGASYGTVTVDRGRIKSAILSDPPIYNTYYFLGGDAIGISNYGTYNLTITDGGSGYPTGTFNIHNLDNGIIHFLPQFSQGATQSATITTVNGAITNVKPNVQACDPTGENDTYVYFNDGHGTGASGNIDGSGNFMLEQGGSGYTQPTNPVTAGSCYNNQITFSW